MSVEAADQTIESLKWAHELGASDVDQKAIDEHPFLVSSKSPILTDLEKFKDAPYRIREAREFTDAKGFALYVQAFENDDTRIFGSLGRKTITAEIDYHGKDDPKWNEHSAALVSVPTAEWQAFRGANGKWFTQTEFAEFLEMWNHVVVEPESAELVEVAMNLEGSINGTFAARVNRNNGSFTFNYQEETTTNQVRVPTSIHVLLSPYFHSALQDVHVLFRFRIQEGRPKFQLAIKNPDRIEHEAMIELIKEVEKEIGRDVLLVP